MEFANVALIIMGVCLCISGVALIIGMLLKKRQQSKDDSDD